jgi:hypothetical protein
MSTVDGRYKLVRFRYVPGEGYQPHSIARFSSKGAAMQAYREGRDADGVFPDLIDTDTGEYIA